MITVYLDGNLYAERMTVRSCNYREAFFGIDTMPKGWHTLRLVIVDGTLEFDTAEITTDSLHPAYQPPKEDKKAKSVPTENRRAARKAKPNKLAKAAIPLAGAAAAGLAVAFTVGTIMKKKRRK